MDKEMGKSMRKMAGSMPMQDMDEMLGNKGKHPTMPIPECKKMKSMMKNSYMK